LKFFLCSREDPWTLQICGSRAIAGISNNVYKETTLGIQGLSACFLGYVTDETRSDGTFIFYLVEVFICVP